MCVRESADVPWKRWLTRSPHNDKSIIKQITLFDILFLIPYKYLLVLFSIFQMENRVLAMYQRPRQLSSWKRQPRPSGKDPASSSSVDPTSKWVHCSSPCRPGSLTANFMLSHIRAPASNCIPETNTYVSHEHLRRKYVPAGYVNSSQEKNNLLMHIPCNMHRYPEKLPPRAWRKYYILIPKMT